MQKGISREKYMLHDLKSAEEHQDRLEKCPDDYCHITKKLLNKY